MMKALTLWQPHASLVAFQEKRIETRSWFTQHRGWLAILAAKRMEKDQAFLLAREPFRSVLHLHGIFLPSQMVRGAILAVCRVADCIPTAQARGYISAQELAFGDYGDNRSAWILEDIHKLAVPVFCSGFQRLWWIPPEITLEIEKQVELH